MSTNARVWFITGVSRGLGRVLAEQVLAAGDKVIGTTRSGTANLKASPDVFRVLELDVTDRDRVMRTVGEAAAIFGRLDVVVNNAGFGLFGAVEDISSPEAHEQFETNFFGALNVIQAALPTLRKQRSGHILNISSMGGISGYKGTGIYSASKFALEGISESLRIEVEPFGIKVTIVEPGAFRTDFLTSESLRQTVKSTEAYTEVIQALEDWTRMNGAQPGDPVRAAKAMIEVTRDSNPPMRLALGQDAYKRIEEKLASVKEDLNRYKAVTFSTDLTDLVKA